MPVPLDTDPGAVVAAGRDLNRVAADFRAAGAPLGTPGLTVLPDLHAALVKAVAALHRDVTGPQGWSGFCDHIGDAAKTTGHIVTWADDSSRTPIQNWPK